MTKGKRRKLPSGKCLRALFELGNDRVVGVRRSSVELAQLLDLLGRKGGHRRVETTVGLPARKTLWGPGPSREMFGLWSIVGGGL